ncbi:MAG: class I SAM-dependent methyltransferase [Gemmataceae bacterium]
MNRQTKTYNEDLAYIHNVGHGDYARRAAPGLLDLLHSHGIDDGLVIDLGCGSGIWAAEISRHGYDVFGIDISPAMIALARKQAPRATFQVDSLLEADLPACAAVTSIGECINYLFDKSNSLRKLSGLFRRVHTALRPGGIFVFDALQPGHVRPSPQRRFREGADWAVLVEIDEDAKSAVLTRTITSFRKVGELYRRDSEVHRQRLYRGAEVARALREAGFRVRRLQGYGAM